MNPDFNTCHGEISSSIHQAHFTRLIQLVKGFKWQCRNVIKWFLIFLVFGCLSFRNDCILIKIVIIVIIIIFDFLLHGFDRSGISDTFSADFNIVLLRLILSFSEGFLTLTESKFFSQKLSPIFIELFNSVKSKSNVIFLLNSLILCSQRNKLDFDLKLLKDSCFKLFSNFKFVSDCPTNTFFVIDFQATHFDWNLILDKFVPQNL